MSTDVSEEHVASIFRAQEQTKQDIGMKHVASSGLDNTTSQNIEHFITAGVETSNHKK
jgi:hypothetical protein